ncbi:RNA-directed DNA polymerase, eukaryota [Tanacetum coccineum]
MCIELPNLGSIIVEISVSSRTLQLEDENCIGLLEGENQLHYSIDGVEVLCHMVGISSTYGIYFGVLRLDGDEHLELSSKVTIETRWIDSGFHPIGETYLGGRVETADSSYFPRVDWTKRVSQFLSLDGGMIPHPIFDIRIYIRVQMVIKIGSRAAGINQIAIFGMFWVFQASTVGGVESSQLALLQTYIEGKLLSNMEDRWVWDLNGEGVFRVKDVRILLDECFLPKALTATRWVKYVPIKINVFAWKIFLDRLPTRSNLQHRGVLVSDLLCPPCSSAQEDSSHLFFSCSLVTDIVRLVCRWWNLSWTPLGSYADWLNWFNSIRLSSKVKDLLEGVLYITWWSV